jgi:hypothetical protein
MSIDLGNIIDSRDHRRDSFNGTALRTAVVEELDGVVNSLDPFGNGRSWIRISHPGAFNNALHQITIEISDLAPNAYVFTMESGTLSVVNGKVAIVIATINRGCTFEISIPKVSSKKLPKVRVISDVQGPVGAPTTILWSAGPVGTPKPWKI